MTLEAFRAQRASQKRAAILEAAEASFRSEGYARASMEGVAKRAQVSTATLYRYFSGKSDLFAAVAQKTMEKLALDPAGSEPSAGRLERLAHAYARLLSDPDTRGFFRMVVAEIGRDQDLAERFYGAVKSQLSDLFQSAITDGVAAGEFSPALVPDLAAGQLQGMIEHATLLRGLVMGDTVETLREADIIAGEALATWRARWSV